MKTQTFGGKMKIPVIYIPKSRFNRYLYIEKRYKSKKVIIPIGCDCHPAYTLQKLNIRTRSLPFDWLNTDPIKGLSFVTENLKNNFVHFLDGLHKNSRGHIVSEKFPFAEFMHEKKLIENKEERDKFMRRIRRLKQAMNDAGYFLFNITSKSLQTEQDVDLFYDSVLAFIVHLKNNQILCIYIRYDESLDENKNNCNKLIELLSSHSNIRVANYIRSKEKDGIWGNASYYPDLYESLGIPIHLTLPKISIK